MHWIKIAYPVIYALHSISASYRSSPWVGAEADLYSRHTTADKRSEDKSLGEADKTNEKCWATKGVNQLGGHVKNL